MTEQPLSSDHEAASVPPAPAQRAPPDMPRARRRPWSGITLVRLAVLFAAGVIVVLFATQWDRWVGLSVRQVTDDAYVRGDITPLSAQVEGYVRRVPVDDFQRVKQGELLVEIEDDDYRARVAQAEADLLGAKPTIEKARRRRRIQPPGGPRQPNRDYLDAPIRRRSTRKSASAGSNADHGDTGRCRAHHGSRRRTAAHPGLPTTFGTRQRSRASSAKCRALPRPWPATKQRSDAQRPARWRCSTRRKSQLRADRRPKAKQARLLDLAKINLGYTRIAAPVGGDVSERGVRDGQYVHAGTPGHLRRAARQCLGRRELQGNPAHPCRDRPARRDPRRHLPGCRRSTRMSTASRRRAARSSACCRRTMRPAISPRSCSGSRSNCGSAPTTRWPANCGRACRSSRRS